MKCPNCGGEVDSQSTACPYCNSVYEPGRLFQLELAEKLEKNKLLPKFILKSRTPKMVSMLLTRLILSLAGASVLCVLLSFGLYMLGEKSLEREPKEGTYAWKYRMESDKRIENEMLREYMYEIVVAIDTGEEIREFALDYVLSNSLYVLQAKPDSEESKIIRAFMVGYLRMTEEELADFVVERDYSEENRMIEALVAKLLLRVGGDGTWN